MRPAAVLFITVFVLIVFGAILVTNTLSVVQLLARVTGIRGVVEVKSPGAEEFEAINKERTVRAGAVLRTGESGSAFLRWADGTSLRVEPETILTIEKCRFDKRRASVLSQFVLEVGRVWVEVVTIMSADSKFEISTPTATAGVRGTTFAVDVGPDGATDVFVYEGHVEVRAGNQNYGVKQGQALAVGVGGDAALRELSEDELSEGKRTEAPAGDETPEGESD